MINDSIVNEVWTIRDGQTEMNVDPDAFFEPVCAARPIAVHESSIDHERAANNAMHINGVPLCFTPSVTADVRQKKPVVMNSSIQNQPIDRATIITSIPATLIWFGVLAFLIKWFQAWASGRLVPGEGSSWLRCLFRSSLRC